MNRLATWQRLARFSLALAAVTVAAACSSPPEGTGGGGTSSTTSTGGSGGTTSGTGGAGGTTTTSSGGTAGQGGSGGATLCTPMEQATKWASMDIAAIVLPNQAALLDLAGANLQGLSVADAQSILCEGEMIGDALGDGNSVIQWGDQGEVWLDFVPATTLGTQITLRSGYTGILAFKGKVQGTNYTIAVGAQILKNGLPFTLEPGWSVNDPTFVQQVTELSNGLVVTFTNDAPDPAGTTCLQSGKCEIALDGVKGSIVFTTVAFILRVDDVTAAQPAPSTPSRLDIGRI